MPYAALGARLLLLAAALAAFAAAASANGIPLKGNPDAKLRAGAANHCSVEGEALDAVQVRARLGVAGARSLGPLGPPGRRALLHMQGC